MTDTTIFTIVLIADIIGLLAIIGALFRPHVQMEQPAWHKSGMIVIAVALLFQGAFCVTALATGVTPPLPSFPFWALKDIGFATIGAGYAWHYYNEVKERRLAATGIAASLVAIQRVKEAKPAAKKRAPAKKAPAKKVVAKKAAK